MIRYKRLFFEKIKKIHPISEQCMMELDKLMIIRKLKHLDYYSTEGGSLSYLSFVCKGILRAYHTDIDGNDWNDFFYREEDFLTAGVSPYIPNAFSVQALSDSEVIDISFEKLEMISSRYPEINIFIQKLSYKCLENRQKREQLLQAKDAVGIYYFFRDKFPGLENKIPQYHIASYIGISPTQLSRIKTKLKNQLHM